MRLAGISADSSNGMQENFIVNVAEIIQKGRQIRNDDYRIPSIVKNKADRSNQVSNGRSYKNKFKKGQHNRSNGPLVHNGFGTTSSSGNSQGFA